jgi:hypothetical protein
MARWWITASLAKGGRAARRRRGAARRRKALERLRKEAVRKALFLKRLMAFSPERAILAPRIRG